MRQDIENGYRVKSDVDKDAGQQSVRALIDDGEDYAQGHQAGQLHQFGVR